MSEIEEQSMLRAIEERPDDDDVRVVYADWLESRGRKVPADFLRTQLALKAAPANPWEFGRLSEKLLALAMRPEITSDFRRAASRPTIEGCDTRLMFACPVTWDRMKSTRDPSVRTCDACAKPVQYVDRIEDARAVAQRGGCIAVDPVVPRKPGDLQPPMPPTAGMPMPPRAAIAPPDLLPPPPGVSRALVPPPFVDPNVAAALLAADEAAAVRPKSKG